MEARRNRMTFQLTHPPRRGQGYDNDLETPPAFFALLDRAFGPFDLDVCASPATAKCVRYFTIGDDCLTRQWGDIDCPSRAFCNPPYAEGLIGPIVAKALAEALAGRCSTLCLFPAKKSEYAWFHDLIINDGGPGATAIYPVRGRIDFWRDGAPLGSPNHASLLVYFRESCVEASTREAYWCPHVLSFDRDGGLVRR